MMLTGIQNKTERKNRKAGEGKGEKRNQPSIQTVRKTEWILPDSPERLWIRLTRTREAKALARTKKGS